MSDSSQQASRRLPEGAVRRLLTPRAIAIVGASATPGALGAAVLGNLTRNGYAGEIHLINPKRAEIAGRPCLESIAALPEGVDVALLAIPQAGVVDAVRELAARRVGAVVIFSAGFAEAGETGLAQQREIAHIAADAGMLVQGPNCLGGIDYRQRLALTFIEVAISAAEAERHRSQPAIGILSQSGAMMTVLNTTLASRGLPLACAISTGNEASSHLEDYLDYLLDDPKTAVIAMIAEQFRQPQRLLALARRAEAQGKRLILLHPGRSSAARAAAATHTGALAGDHAVMRTLVERAGVVLAETLEELGDIAEIALRCPALPSAGTAIVGESGAFKALCLDLCEALELPLPTIGSADSPALREALPPFVEVSNPLDLTAQGLVDPQLYRRTLEALFADTRFGTVLVGLIQTDPVTCRIKLPPVLQAVREKQPQFPVICAGLDEGAEIPADYVSELRELGVPYFPSHERALRAIARLHPLATRDSGRMPPASHGLALPEQGGVIPEYRAKQLLAPLGVPFGAGELATSLAEAQRIAADLGGAVALKAQAAALSHKSDVGGVVLGVEGETQLARAWERLHQDLARLAPDTPLDGVLVERMGAAGCEMIVGARHDPQWGPVVLVGFGGVTAEVLRDVRLLPADLTPAAVRRELDKLKGAALLHGHRGKPACDVAALAELVAALGALMQAEPRLVEIDLNPVMVYPEGQGVLALDALMLIA
ncbi:acetate--CoA ligase family protein [Salinicola tamaricis]|uniref:acetate--CoA ligase family protein n=1 Tax=Salinicola tamaricis TaxID=1771309 RepID=UPI000D0A3053|nr:acetate--CoA ligase family protein [Salinicola tamaricis]